jgi:hypothetical protein
MVDKLRAVSIEKPRFLPPLSKVGLRAAERVRSPQKYFTPIPREKIKIFKYGGNQRRDDGRHKPMLIYLLSQVLSGVFTVVADHSQ